MDQRLIEKSDRIFGAIEDLEIKKLDACSLLELVKIQALRIEALELAFDDALNRIAAMEDSIEVNA